MVEEEDAVVFEEDAVVFEEEDGLVDFLLLFEACTLFVGVLALTFKGRVLFFPDVLVPNVETFEDEAFGGKDF